MNIGTQIMENIVKNMLIVKSTKKITHDRKGCLKQNFSNSTFTISEAAEVLGIKKNATQKAINKLIKVGAIKIVEERHSNSPAKYKMETLC